MSDKKRTATEIYIDRLLSLKPGARGLLRSHCLQPLDESTDAFDLFAGLWWPLRQNNPKVPRRSVAWLVAKLIGSCQIEHHQGRLFSTETGRRAMRFPRDDRQRFETRFDQLLIQPADALEPELLFFLRDLHRNEFSIDWVQLTDDLSGWAVGNMIQRKWAKQFVDAQERNQ